MNEQPTTPAARLVEFLRQVAMLRSKMIRDIADYEKTLWFSEIPKEDNCRTPAWGSDQTQGAEEWLVVGRKTEPSLPEIPAACRNWIEQKALYDKATLPTLLETSTTEVPNPDWSEDSDEPETIPHTERLEDHPELREVWKRYVAEKWQPWVDTHNAWEKAHRVYSALFAIHQALQRSGEEYELVLGLGLLTWLAPSDEQRVRRHLLVANAMLEFEAKVGRFTVRPHPEGARLRPELDMLNPTDQPGQAEEAAREALATGDDDPWQQDCVEGVLKALVHSIDPQGRYSGALAAEQSRATNKPVVEFAPALILRKRSSKGVTDALDQIRKQIEDGMPLPAEFADIAEIRPVDARPERETDPPDTGVFDGEIYFPMPSNEEQRRIVDRIRSSSGVLVQGPPGTGKSHTIANLICHLLATGQRTLITAKTPRALQVLEGLVPEELRPLCINLLGSGQAEQRSLQASVEGILNANEEWNEASAMAERAPLEKQLHALREEKAQKERQLRDIRESETKPQSVAEGRYRGTAARIAEAVNEEREKYEWFTDVPATPECFLSSGALLQMLRALREATLERREELALECPALPLTADEFAAQVRQEQKAMRAEQTAVAAGADAAQAESLAEHETSHIQTARKSLAAFLEARNKTAIGAHPWLPGVLNDVLCGNAALWHDILRVTLDVVTSVGARAEKADSVSIAFPESCDPRTLRDDAIILKEHLESGGSLGVGPFRPQPVKGRQYIIKSVLVGGRPCATVEQLADLADALHVRLECEKAWNYWRGRAEKVRGPYALQLTALKSLGDALDEVLSLETTVANGRAALRQCSLAEPSWADGGEVGRVMMTCQLALAGIVRRRAANALQTAEEPLSALPVERAHPIARQLLAAIRNRNIDEYAQCSARLETLHQERLRLRKLDDDLEELRRVVPNLAAGLLAAPDEPVWEERLRGLEAAWHWAQAKSWLEDYIRKEDAPALAGRARQIEEEIHSVIGRLAASHAWSFCFKRLTEEHRREMQAWKQAMGKLGKGTGKHAPRHRRDAQKHLNNCREAIPAWVMPLHRIWDTVAPAPGIFDVIIVDEASQCGLEALPLFYLGKKIVIVGDDKQISPEAVGVDQNAVALLQKQYLDDFRFHDSFSVESSLFDHAKLRHSARCITLREHFRCMPEIIRFSNDLCYAETPLIPLRQYGPDRLPPLDHVFVRGGYREGKGNSVINRPKAEAVAAEIVKMCGDSRYDGKSIGVIVLQGEAQAKLIEQLLLETIGVAEMEKRRLICGNPYSFQGDERDVMLLSLVAAPNERIGALTKAADERRFNVAASRARDRMALFHSVTAEDLNPDCFRRKLLEFFQQTALPPIPGVDRDELERRAARDNRSVVKAPTPFDSWFEVDVALELLRKNYVVLPQHEVAGYRIDLVIDGGQARLAVECDGDHWHGADRYEADMQRQRQLERCGWAFFRVRESAFYANKATALQGLWHVLEERGIFPQR